ncbi:MAG: transposase [Candidatus Taylorbacteria bacterium]|nr:transposase [Candidatus Taylorbacteria bacterium]
MGNRDYKQSGAGGYFHIYNRGNAKNNVFIDNEDFEFFILKINQNLFPDIYRPKRLYSIPIPDGSFSLISYCLMPNHFHFLIRQNGDIPVSKLILKVCTSYSKCFNKKYSRVGHVFQDQFKQVLVEDNDYLKWLSVYIHQNPKVALLVNRPADYKWSSCADYINGSEGLISCDKEIILSQFGGLNEYSNFLDGSYEIIKSKKQEENIFLD